MEDYSPITDDLRRRVEIVENDVRNDRAEANRLRHNLSDKMQLALNSNDTAMDARVRAIERAMNGFLAASKAKSELNHTEGKLIGTTAEVRWLRWVLGIAVLVIGGLTAWVRH